MHRLALPLAALLLCVYLPAASAAPKGKQERLVNARFRSQPDSKGFNYTCDQNGRVNSNYGWLFSGVNINRSSLSVQQRLMRPDGSEYVLKGRVNNFNVTRRMKVDRKNGGVRMVETIHNGSTSPQVAQIIIYAQLNYRYQRVLTNTGRAAAGQLQKKEVGVVGMLQGVQGAALYHLCSATGRVRPTIMVKNNQQLQFHFSLQIPAGATMSILHGGVILRQTPGNSAKALGSLFKPYRGRKFQRDLPSEVRRSLVNVRGGSVGGDATIPTIEQELEVAPGPLDQLAFTQDTLLQGTASCTRLTVEGSHGKVSVPFARVGAIVGERNKALAPRILMRDGQKLMGTVEAEGLRFEMTSGMAIDLDVKLLDRLVLRTTKAAASAAGTEPKDPLETPDVSYLVETFGGNRLRTQKQSESFRVATQWGEMTVPVEELKRLYLAGDEMPGYWVELTDASRFRGFLRDSELTMKSDLFGTLKLRPHEIRRILAVRRRTRALDDSEDSDLDHPHIVLAGGDVFVGRIDLDALHFLGPGGALPQPPAQIRQLHNQLEGNELGVGESLRFRADVWGGGHVTGELRELVVPVQTTRGRLQVPVRDLADVHVPTPVVPEVLRTRLRDLVRALGHPSWEKREAATIALAELGDMAKSALERVIRETKDPEVKRRARRLLDKI